MRLSVFSGLSSLTSILSRPFSLIKVACCSSIFTFCICSSLCDAASFLARMRLSMLPRIIAKSATVKRTSHSGTDTFVFLNPCIRKEKQSIQKLTFTYGALQPRQSSGRVPPRRWRWGRCLRFSRRSPRRSPRRFLDRWYLTYQHFSWCS